MPEPVHPPTPDTPEKPLGLLDLWRVRKSFVYRFATRRLRRESGVWLQSAALSGIGMVYVVLSLYGATQDSEPPDVWTMTLMAVRLVVLIAATVAGVRVFAGERAGETLNALTVTTSCRRELTTGLFFAHFRPYVWFFVVITVARVSAVAMKYAGLTSELVPELNLVILMYMAVVVVSFFCYFSGLMLGSVIGLYCGLRLRSTVGAYGLSLTVFLILWAAEFWVGYRLLDGGLFDLADEEYARGSLIAAFPLAIVNLALAARIMKGAVQLLEGQPGGPGS